MSEQGLAARFEALDGYHRVRWNYGSIERSMYIFARAMRAWIRKNGARKKEVENE